MESLLHRRLKGGTKKKPMPRGVQHVREKGCDDIAVKRVSDGRGGDPEGDLPFLRYYDVKILYDPT